MFSEECIATIFGNIEKIYEFQKRFLEELESSNNGGAPYASDIGTIFLRNVSVCIGISLKDIEELDSITISRFLSNNRKKISKFIPNTATIIQRLSQH